MTFHPDSLPDLSSKVYIVTGGNSGIGYHTVKHLAEHNAHVYLCARSEEKGNAAIKSITALHPNAKITLLLMDHSSLASVTAATKLFLSQETALHGLVNNAGVMNVPYEITRDGHEIHWQTNYLAHWVLTSHLVPLMLKTSLVCPSGTVRIVNLTSAAHFLCPKGGINWADTSLPNSHRLRYGQSKLANALHAKTLHLEYGPDSKSASEGAGEIWTTAVHPGLVESELATRSADAAMNTLLTVLKFFGGYIDADRGSYTSLFCAASPDLKSAQSGTYFERIAKAGSESANAKNPKLAAELESWTLELMTKGGWVGKS